MTACERVRHDFGIDLPATFPISGIVGYAIITGVVTQSESLWYISSQHGFVLTELHTLDFIFLNGKLGLFDVPADIAENVSALLKPR